MWPCRVTPAGTTSWLLAGGPWVALQGRVSEDTGPGARAQNPGCDAGAGGAQGSRGLPTLKPVSGRGAWAALRATLLPGRRWEGARRGRGRGRASAPQAPSALALGWLLRVCVAGNKHAGLPALSPWRKDKGHAGLTARPLRSRALSGPHSGSHGFVITGGLFPFPGPRCLSINKNTCHGFLEGLCPVSKKY